MNQTVRLEFTLREVFTYLEIKSSYARNLNRQYRILKTAYKICNERVRSEVIHSALVFFAQSATVRILPRSHIINNQKVCFYPYF